MITACGLGREMEGMGGVTGGEGKGGRRRRGKGEGAVVLGI